MTDPFDTLKPGRGPLGKRRGTGFAMLMGLLTGGIYLLYWAFSVHEEMRHHRDEGIGGPIALLIGLVFWPALGFITPKEVGELYTSRGLPAPVTSRTGLWVFPGILFLIGPLVWFMQVNRAIDEYWALFEE